MKSKGNSLYSSKNPIFYIAIGDLVNRRIIVDYFPQGKNKQHSYKSAFLSIIDKLILISIAPNERYKESFENDKKFHCSMDNKANVVFLVLVYENYPERYCYKLLEDLENKSISTINKYYINFKNTNNQATLEETFKTHAKDIQLYMVELERNYRDIVANDKIKLIQNEVDDMKSEMKQNLNNMLDNIELVSNLEDKSTELKDMAKEYKIGAKDLKKTTIWGRRKKSIIAGGLTLSALFYFGFRFFK